MSLLYLKTVHARCSDRKINRLKRSVVKDVQGSLNAKWITDRDSEGVRSNGRSFHNLLKASLSVDQTSLRGLKLTETSASASRTRVLLG